jgi:predicted Rossmann fold nucleotide-binding protein DprA/Smf involved in DNA uptake
MNNDSLAVLLLTNRLVEVDEKPLTAKEIWSLYAKIPQIGQVLDCTAEALVSEHGLDLVEAERTKKLCDAATAFTFEMERLEESGIRVLSFLDDGFPKRVTDALGTKSSAFLLVAGNINLFDRTGRGIVGSRNASEEIVSVAQSAANAAERQGDVVVSGLAKGVDQVAMSAALDSDGEVIGVPTEGIRRIAKSNDVRKLVHEGRICLVSPYAPDVGFSVGLAMGRNRFVYALSESTLVVASDLEKGGTWAGADEALKGDFAQVDVWTGEGATEGNTALVAKGAHAVPSRDEFWLSGFSPAPAVFTTDPEQLKLSFD